MKMKNPKITKIAITGGKGGTGKSTVAVLFANELARENKKVILIDCDVECPNDYLIVGQKLKQPVKKVYAHFPKIDKAKCKKCGACVKICKNNALFQAPRQYPILIEELCSGCGACRIVCPNQAIKTQKKEIGNIYFNKINKNLILITGVAKPVLEETSAVVQIVKEYSFNIAKKIKPDYIIIDTAAGTHCPVINALLDSDFAYAVTEPTPMGAYDLKLILDLCKKLKIPAQIILNQADLGDKKEIKKIVKKFKTKIEKKIPYSKKIVELYSQGKLLDLKL